MVNYISARALRRIYADAVKMRNVVAIEIEQLKVAVKECDETIKCVTDALSSRSGGNGNNEKENSDIDSGEDNEDDDEEPAKERIIDKMWDITPEDKKNHCLPVNQQPASSIKDWNW